VTVICGHITISMLRGNTAYCMKLSDKICRVIRIKSNQLVLKNVRITTVSYYKAKTRVYSLVVQLCGQKQHTHYELEATICYPKKLATLVIDTFSLHLSLKTYTDGFYIPNIYVDIVVHFITIAFYCMYMCICVLTCTQLRLTTVFKE